MRKMKGDGKGWEDRADGPAAESRPSASHAPPGHGPHHSLYHMVWLAAFQLPGKED